MKFVKQIFATLIICLFQSVFATQAVALENEVVFKTNMGSFILELFPTRAPNTVANFLTYVDEGYYDNTIFHRVIKDFVVQGGGFKKGMVHEDTHAPVKNESSNKLKNKRGTISLARRNHPDTGTSQFYINLVDNTQLDWKAKHQPGYTVFGKITSGMDVIDKIAQTPIHNVDKFNDMPKDDVVLHSVTRKDGKVEKKSGDGVKQVLGNDKTMSFVAGEHYVVLDKPVATRDKSKVEVIEMFSYGCAHCYEFEPLVKRWSKAQGKDVDFWFFPAVWNKPMKLLAKAFYVAHELNVSEKIHLSLFSKVVLEQQSVRNENDLAEFFEKHGVDKNAFSEAFNSEAVEDKVIQAESRVKKYKPVGVPEIVVNGKYRVDRMRAGGQEEMLDVVNFLVNKERAILKK